jgi:hypothetical protein
LGSAGRKKGVVWLEDSTGTWGVRGLPHYAPNLSGQANDIIYLVNFIRAIGWAVNAEGDTIPQVWESEDEGVNWTRTPLPLLEGGTVGSANGTAVGNPGFVAGWSEKSEGERLAVNWVIQEDDEPPIKMLTTEALPGYANSGGQSAYVEGNSRWVVGHSFNSSIDRVATLWLEEYPYPEESVYDLNTLVDNPGSIVLEMATGLTVSDLVYITANGSVPGARTGPHAVLLKHVRMTDVASREPKHGRHAFAVTTHPNPFSVHTSVAFHLPAPGSVQLTVHDVRGRRVETLVEGFRNAGDHQLSWQGTDECGRSVTPGVYWLRLQCGSVTETKKITLVK